MYRYSRESINYLLPLPWTNMDCNEVCVVFAGKIIDDSEEVVHYVFVHLSGKCHFTSRCFILCAQLCCNLQKYMTKLSQMLRASLTLSTEGHTFCYPSWVTNQKQIPCVNYSRKITKDFISHLTRQCAHCDSNTDTVFNSSPSILIIRWKGHFRQYQNMWRVPYPRDQEDSECSNIRTFNPAPSKI